MSDLRLGPLESQWGDSLSAVPNVDCPSAMSLIDFVEMGEASPDFGSIVCHLASCSECRNSVLEMRSVTESHGREPKALVQPLGWWQRSAWIGLMGAASVAVATTAIVLSLKQAPNSQVSNSGVAVRPHQNLLAQNSKSEKKEIGSSLKPITSIRSGGSHSVVTTKTGVQSSAAPLSKLNTVQGKASPKNPSTMPVPNITPRPNLMSTPTQYCLVGPNGSYLLSSSSDQASVRKSIELDYADAISKAQANCHQKIEEGADQATAEHELQMDLQDAEKRRDDRLGQIYQKQDRFLNDHDELKSACDGPYQLVEVHYSSIGTVANYVILPPWPGYQRQPYYWEYHHQYRPEELRNAKSYWLVRYRNQNRPAFVGLVGHKGNVVAEDIHRTSEGRLSYRPYTGSRHLTTDVARMKPTGYQTRQPETTQPTRTAESELPNPVTRSPYRGSQMFRSSIGGMHRRDYHPLDHKEIRDGTHSSSPGNASHTQGGQGMPDNSAQDIL